MGKLAPFSCTHQEASEIRQIGRLLFWGGDPTVFEETKEMYEKWEYIFRLFLLCCDRKTGSFLNMPFSGGVAEQPAKTMHVLMLVQSIYCEKLADQNKVGIHGKNKL